MSYLFADSGLPNKQDYDIFVDTCTCYSDLNVDGTAKINQLDVETLNVDNLNVDSLKASTVPQNNFLVTNNLEEVVWGNPYDHLNKPAVSSFLSGDSSSIKWQPLSSLVPNANMNSCRFGFSGTFQLLSPTDNNPSYLTDISSILPQYEYDNSNNSWTISAPDTVTINKTGNYEISLNIGLVSDQPATGDIILNILIDGGAIGNSFPILACIYGFITPSFSLPPPFISTTSCVGTATVYLLAGTQLKIAYSASQQCNVSPTSSYNIILLEGPEGPEGPPGPAGDNIYNINGVITDPVRSIDCATNDLHIENAENIILQSNNTIELNSPQIFLNEAPLLDNLNVSVLCRDPVSGLLEEKEVSSFENNIYTNDGSLSSDRIVTMNNNDLFFNGDPGSLFSVSTDQLDLTTPDLNISAITIKLNQPLITVNTVNSLLARTVLGDIVERQISSIPSVNLYNTNDSLTSNRTVTMGSNDLLFNGTLGSLFSANCNQIDLVASDINLNSANISLTQPLSINNSINSLMGRDNLGEIVERQISSIPSTNLYNTNGTLSSNRSINYDIYSLTNNILGNNFSIIGNNGVSAIYNGTSGSISHAANSIISFNSPFVRLQQAPANVGGAFQVLCRDNTSGDLRLRSSSLFNRYSSYPFTTDLTTLNMYYYINNQQGNPGTLNLPSSLNGISRLASGWVVDYYPTNIQVGLNISPKTTAVTNGSITISLYYLGQSLVSRNMLTETLVFSNNMIVGTDIGLNIVLSPASYPGANINSCYSVVINNTIGTGVFVNGYIRFYE